MKKKQTIAAFLLSLIVPLLVISCVSTPPDWYLNREVSSGFIVGVGEGKTKDKAKTEALREIAEQLKIRVVSETTVEEKILEGASSLLFEQDIKTATDIVLTGAVKVAEEKRGGLYYVTYRYDNRPLSVRVLDAARNGEITSFPPGKVGSLWQTLRFYRFLVKNNLPGNFMLSRNNGLWSVSVGNRSFSLSARALVEDFFPSKGEGSIFLIQGALNGSAVIGQPSDALREGQNFSLKITPMETGFLTLFYIDNAGIVVNLLENEPVEEGASFFYPDPKIYSDGLIAEPAAGFTSSTDMILGLITPEPFDLFFTSEKVSENSVDSDNEGLYAYGRLLEALKGEETGVDWCSSLIHIAGNKP